MLAGKLLLISAIAFASVIATPAKTSAAAGTAYIKYGSWNCNQGGSVVLINGSQVNPTGHAVAGVPGNTATHYVFLNQKNYVFGSITCAKRPFWYAPWVVVNYHVYVYGPYGSGVQIWPQFSGHTIWI
jgi:hypothetical protein